ALPARAHGVDDPLGGEGEPGRGLGVPRVAAAELAARRLQLAVPGGPVDGAVDAAAPGEALVGGVHDGVHLFARDVALDGFDAHSRHPSLRAFSCLVATFPLASDLLLMITFL